MKTIIAAVDLSPDSRKVMRLAEDLAKSIKARIHLCYVMDTSELRFALKHELQGEMQSSEEIQGKVKKYVDSSMRKIAGASENGVDKFVVLHGFIADSLIAYARKIGALYIVCGTRRRSASASFFLGSTAQELLRRSRIPVVVVPAGAANKQAGTVRRKSRSLRGVLLSG